MEKSAKLIRIITAPPLMAFIFISVLYFAEPHIFLRRSDAFVLALFYTLLPLSAYVISKAVPRFRASGRKTERTLAVILSVAGYIFAVVFFALRKGSPHEWIIVLTYLISGAVIGVSSAFGLKISGHTCGVAGPICCLALFWDLRVFFALLVLMPVFWASLKTERHTKTELILGMFLPLAVNFLLYEIII